MDGVLGLSLGTRSMGVAILWHKKLADFHLRSFHGTWSKEKLTHILDVIGQYIDRNRIEIVGIKIPDVLPLSENYMQLIGALNVLFESKDVKVYYYSLSELKKHFCDTKRVSKSDLSGCLTQKYPALLVIRGLNDTKKTSYYSRVFEAAAVAIKVEQLHI